MKQKIDLHNHTYLCKHAEGIPVDFVQKAIEKKIDIYGFADHAPMDFNQEYRMSAKQMDLYETMVYNAQERFGSKIEVLLGYEVDFIDGYILDDVLQRRCDYLIGSVHFINEWGFDNPEFIAQYENENIDEIWQKYFDAIKKMAQSGQFQIVGHLDLIKIFRFCPQISIDTLAHDALLAIQKSNMAVEINSAGFRKPVQEQYPSREILQKLLELEIPITFSSDAHRTSEVGLNLDQCIELAKDIGFTQAAIFRNKKMEMIKI